MRQLRKATSPVWQGRFYVPRCATLYQFFRVNLFGSTGTDFVFRIYASLCSRYNFANAPVTKAATLQSNNKTKPVPNLEGDPNAISKATTSCDYPNRVVVVFRASAEITYNLQKIWSNFWCTTIKNLIVLYNYKIIQNLDLSII